MEREYETMYVYRVFYLVAGEMREAFFTNKEDAGEFSEIVGGHLSRWSWQMKIEK